MRDLNAIRNVAEIVDPVSGDVHEIYYNLPTNGQRIRYSNAFIRRKGNKIQMRRDGLVVNLEHGTRLITGFKKGSFGYDGELFASEQTDPDYREDWKELLVKSCPEIVVAVARVAFAPARSKGEMDGAMVEFEDVEELEADESSDPLGSD